MFLRTVLLALVVYRADYAHASNLARGTTGNLLHTELDQLALELIKLHEQVRLRLVLEILSANLSLQRLC